jgi:hypothetical protein
MSSHSSRALPHGALAAQQNLSLREIPVRSFDACSPLHHLRCEWFVGKPSRILKLGKLTKEESAKSFHEGGGDGLTSSAVEPLCRESSLLQYGSVLSQSGLRTRKIETHVDSSSGILGPFNGFENPNLTVSLEMICRHLIRQCHKCRRPRVGADTGPKLTRNLEKIFNTTDDDS